MRQVAIFLAAVAIAMLSAAAFTKDLMERLVNEDHAPPPYLDTGGKG